MEKRNFLLAFCMLISIVVWSQDGPGGIGNGTGSDGQPRNILWLDASSLGLSNGSNVATWGDISGNGYDAEQSTGGNQPVYVSSFAGINNQPLVEFDGTSQFMWLPTEITTTENGIVGDDFACIMVAGRSTTDSEWFMGGNGDGPYGGNLHVGWRDGNTWAFGFWGNDVNGDPSPTPAANTLQITYMDLNRSASPARRLYQDGVSVNTGTSTSTLSAWESPTLGRRSGSTYGDLLLAELIFYKGELNHAHRVIIDNYLAEKYALTISNDFYNNSAYQTDLTGIGQIQSQSYTSSNSSGFYIIDNGGLSDGEFVFFAHDGTTNEASVSELPSGVEERWARDWYIESTTGFDVKLVFDLPEAIGGDYPKEISNYRLLYKANAGDASYQVVSTVTAEYDDNDQVVFPITSADLANGYYTLGTINSTDSPVEGLPGITYYTLASGNWNDPDIWTLDPSGALPNNPSSLYPSLESDNVVVKNGKTVTVNVDNLSCAGLKVEGRLDLASTSGHSFDVIQGSGRILMQDDNFPSGDASHFITEGQGEGTVEFNGGDFTLSSAREFFDVELNLNTSSNTLTILNDLEVNGNLTLVQGGLKLNNDVSSTILNLTVDGNVDVQANSNISVGTGNTIGSYSIGGTMPASGEYHNIYHQFSVGGNFTNNGTVRLTNLDAPTYDQFAGNGAVTLRFTGASDNTFYCYNTTDLYNLVIEKGTDRTYVLEVYSDAVSDFRLFGANNYGRNTSSPFSAENPEVRKALWVYQGTLKLTGNVYIPSLSEGAVGGGNGDYAIGYNAKLWIAGADVKVYSTAYDADDIPGFTTSDTNTAVGVSTSGSNCALSLYGEFQIDNGLFDTDNSYGFVFWDSSNPTAKINGGQVNVEKLYQSGSGTATYKQTGGKLTITSVGDFDLSNTNAVFHMSGGEIEMQAGDFYVGSQEGNYKVTGGTLTINQNGGSTPEVNTTAPLYNVAIERLNTGGTTTLDLQSELVVLNDLTINANSFLDHNGNDITIGRNMWVDENAAQVGTNNYGYLYDASQPNTTTFDGSEDAELYIGHSQTNSGYELYLYNMVVDKATGAELTLMGDPEKEAGNVSTLYYARLVQVTNDFSLLGGLFNQGEHSVRLFGNVAIAGDAQLGVYEPGVTQTNACFVFRGDGLAVDTEEGAVIGNFKMDVDDAANDEISFTSDVKIIRMGYVDGKIDLGSYKLTIDYLHGGYSTSNYTDNDANEVFYTGGIVSDGGLSLLIDGNGTYVFPVGVSGKYTPVQMVLDNFSDEGYVTINPVDGELMTTDQGGGDLLDYYWRVRQSDFETLPNVSFVFEYEDADVVGNESNYYPGRVLGVNPYTRSYINDKNRVDDSNNQITYDNGSGGTIELVTANYTAGKVNRFTGDVQVFYSRDNTRQANWRDNNTWTRSDRLDDIDNNGQVDDYEYHDSRQPGVNDYPQEGDIAVIGWVPWGNTTSSGNEGEPHGIWIDNTTENCAEVIFTQMEDVSGNPTPRVYRSNFQFRPCLCINNNGSLSTDLMSGEGMIWARYSDPDFSLIDMGEFAAEDSSYIAYENSTNSRVIYNTPDVFPNLMIANDGWGGSDRDITFEKDIVTNGNLEILGDADLVLDNDADGDLTIGGNLLFFEIPNPVEGSPSGGGAELVFPNDGTERIVTVGGDIQLYNAGNQIYVNSADGTALDHELHVSGYIHQTDTGNGLNLCDGVSNDRVTLYLEGDTNSTIDITAGSNPDLYRLIVDKGSDNSTTVSMNCDFALQGATSGVGVDKALEIQNGTLILNNIDIDIDLTTGDDFFEIPSTGALEVMQGTVNTSGNSGIYLDGLLKVSGGAVDMSDGDNPIEYSASGNAQIEVTSGILTVGSQIRRSLTTDEGILSYTQSGGTVVVGQYSAPESDRGVFEILGSDSYFGFTGGTLQIANGQSNATIASVYLNPETSNVGDGTVLTFDPVQTSGINEIGIYSTVALKNILLKDDANLEVKQWTVPLTVEENFEIESNAAFNANGQDLEVGGDFTINGTFTHGNNTTIFTGDADQLITGNVTFYNVTKNGSAGLTLHTGDSEIDIENVLDFQGGTLTDNSNNLNIQGYCSFAGTHVYGGSGKGIVLNGSSNQQFSGGGTLGMLTINNLAGVDVPLGNEFTINNKLRLEGGIFNIDKNLLLLTEDCIVEHGNDDFSSTNMVQTNISFTDNGVQKIFPVVDRDSDPVYDFTYPMGSGGKYTPVTVAITNNDDNAGSLTVKPANEYHPSVEDPNNVLQYHWELRASGVEDFEAELRLKYEPTDVYVEAPNDISDYYTARLLSDGTGNWNKFSGEDVIDESSNELVFDFLGTNDAGISGAYTAGLNAAIPDQVPGYITISDGDWTNENIWDTYPVSGGTVPAGGPRGSLVYISHDVNVPSNFLSVYRTSINEGGTLNIGSTFGHRIGELSGTGTMVLADQGSLPAGVYDDFFSVTGGTLTFEGTTDFDFLSDINSVNNLVLSGSGERRFPNIDITVLNDLTIDGVDAINEYDRNLTLKGDLIFSAGTYDAGTGSSTVTFSGTEQQEISGVAGFSGSNAFYNVAVSNASGLLLSSDVDVSNQVNLSNGYIDNTSGSVFRISNNNAEAFTLGASGKYVTGPLQKLINNGGQFVFPVGASDRDGEITVFNTSSGAAAYWEVEYYNNSPSNEGYDVSSFTGDIEYVSHNEYWRIEAPASGNTAQLTMSWDASSGVTADNTLRVVNWTDLATDAWSELSTTNRTGTNTSGTIDLSSSLSFGFDGSNNNCYLTFGTISIPAFTWLGTSSDWYDNSNWSGGSMPTGASDITINTSANDPIIDPANETGLAQVNDLTISAGASLTLLPGAKFTVAGDLVTNDGLIIQNTVDNPASIITSGTITGETRIQWSGFTEMNWWHIGHGVLGVRESEYDNSIGEDTYALNRYTTSWERVGGINEVYSDSYPFDDELEGYSLLFRDAGETLVYSGVLNGAESYSKSNLTGQWHHYANPYPSYLDVEAIGFDMDNFMRTIYTDAHDDMVMTYNVETNIGVNGGTRYIAPGQAFWIRNYVYSDFSIARSSRVHTSGSLKSSAVEDENIFRMELKSSVATDEAVVLFGDRGSDEKTRLDSEKMMNSGDVANLYSLKSEEEVAVNFLPELLTEQKVVPIGFKVSAKGMEEFTFKASNINSFYPQTSVYLVDKLEGHTIDLRETPVYSFTPESTNSNDRFELRFEQITTDLENETNLQDSENKVVIYVVDQVAHIKLDESIFNENLRMVKVYNMAGQLIKQQELNALETQIELPSINNMFIIKVQIGDKVYQKKTVPIM